VGREMTTMIRNGLGAKEVTVNPSVNADQIRGADIVAVIDPALLDAARQARGGNGSGGYDARVPAPGEGTGRTLYGATVGIHGYGDIGQEVGRMLRDGFGVSQIYYTRSKYYDGALDQPGISEVRSLDDMLAQRPSIISFNAPAPPPAAPGQPPIPYLTRAHLESEALRNAVVINTSRGTAIDEQAVADALRGGHLAAGGFDVYQNEHLP